MQTLQNVLSIVDGRHDLFCPFNEHVASTVPYFPARLWTGRFLLSARWSCGAGRRSASKKPLKKSAYREQSAITLCATWPIVRRFTSRPRWLEKRYCSILLEFRSDLCCSINVVTLWLGFFVCLISGWRRYNIGEQRSCSPWKKPDGQRRWRPSQIPTHQHHGTVLGKTCRSWSNGRLACQKGGIHPELIVLIISIFHFQCDIICRRRPRTCQSWLLLCSNNLAFLNCFL